MHSKTSQCEGASVDCILVSSYYWPTLQPQSMKHHDVISSLVEEYREAYAIVRKPRSLMVAPQLGLVQLELEFDDGTVKEYSVAPAQVTLQNSLLYCFSFETQASLILFLSESGSTTLGVLAQQCDSPLEEIRQKMGYWIYRRVVREIFQSGCPLEDILYEVVEKQDVNNEDSLTDAYQDIEVKKSIFELS